MTTTNEQSQYPDPKKQTQLIARRTAAKHVNITQEQHAKGD